MAQFDVHTNTNAASQREVPYLLDIQSELLDGLATRVVVPLFRKSAFGKPVQRLHPEFDIAGVAVVMSTAELAGIPRRNLGKKVESLVEHRSVIVSAVDLLMSGV